MVSEAEQLAQFEDQTYLPLVPELRSLFRKRYSRKLGYHGPHHHDAVTRRAIRNREQMLQHKVPDVPSKFRTMVGASAHDNWYERYFLEGFDRYFKSPEEFHMYASAEVLTDAGVGKETIDGITDDILGTKAGERCSTVGRFMLCAADLRPTMIKNRGPMRVDTKKLYEEDKYLKNRDLGELGFNVLSMGVLATFHVVNLNNPRLLRACPPLGAEHRQQGINIGFMLTDNIQLFGDKTKEQIRQLPPLLRDSALNLLKL